MLLSVVQHSSTSLSIVPDCKHGSYIIRYLIIISMSSKQTQVAMFHLLGMILGVAAFYVFPMQEAMASLLNINGNKVLSGNQNKGKNNNNKNCVALC